MSNNKDYSTSSASVISRKERQIEAAKESLNALKNQIHKLHKSLLSDKDVKNSISQEILNGVKGNTPVSGVLAKLAGSKTSAAHGFNSDDLETFNNANNSPTGEEDRYWESDY